MGQLHETTIRIRGAAYQLRTDLPAQRLQELAVFVDDTMHALDPKANVPPGKLSVLASLTIAGDLFEERRKVQEMEESVEHRVARLSQMLEVALGDARAG